MAAPRIKICGVKTKEDVKAVVESGADGIGLNFFPPSKRFISVSVAADLVAGLPNSVFRVGVFVDAEISTLKETAAAVPLDLLQLHGNEETPATLSQLQDFAVVRAVFPEEQRPTPWEEWQSHGESSGGNLAALLLDKKSGGLQGGSGKVLDWRTLPEKLEPLSGIPLLLAGGLRPENVREAIRLVKPFGVDVASGVEDESGRKSAQKIRKFVEEAKLGFADIGASS